MDDPTGAGLLCEEDPEVEFASGLEGGDNMETEQAPPRFENGETVLVSLSAGSVDATCPAGICHTPCTPVAECSELGILCSQLRKTLTPLLAQVLDRTDAAPKRRPRQKRQPISNPRRSVRIARGIECGSSATKQQNVLIQKLCLANEGEVISDDALQAYVKLFEKPLTDTHVKAILAPFSWEPKVLPLI